MVNVTGDRPLSKAYLINGNANPQQHTASSIKGRNLYVGMVMNQAQPYKVLNFFARGNLVAKIYKSPGTAYY